MQKVNARDKSPMNGLFEIVSMQEGSSQVGVLKRSLYGTILPVKEDLAQKSVLNSTFVNYHFVKNPIFSLRSLLLYM